MTKEFKEYTSLESDCGKYKLSHTPNYSFPTAIFDINKEGLVDEYFDNPDYIFKTLYEVIKLWVTEKKVLDGEEFSEIVRVINLQDFDLIYRMLNRALELKFNQ